MTREEHIYLWKTTGGNYTWRKWAAMHGLPEHNENYIAELKAAAAPKPLPVKRGEFKARGYTAVELKEVA